MHVVARNQARSQVAIDAEHFDDVGQVYALPLSVAWTPSPKNPKWKDIVAVTLR